MSVSTTIFEGSMRQISGRPRYTFRLGCSSGKEPKFCLLVSDGGIVEEAGRVGYVLGSEGS